MSGDEFQQRIGKYERVWSEKDQNWDVKFENE